MMDLDPCLRGCDIALEEADLLIAMLTATPDSLRPEMSAVRSRIALLRHEVGRLRGLSVPRQPRYSNSECGELDGEGLPWPQRNDPATDS